MSREWLCSVRDNVWYAIYGCRYRPTSESRCHQLWSKHNYEVDQWVGDVSAQRYKRLAGSSQKVKTGIAKCRYRVKGCHPDAFDAIITEENRKHGSHAEQFNKQCTLYAEFGQADNTADFGAEIASCIVLRCMSEISVRINGKGNSNGDDTQPAGLDQQQNNCLTKRRPVTAGVLYNKPCDTYRWNRGE